MARSPNVVSLIFCPVSKLIVPAKNLTPARRIMSLVSWLPSLRRLGGGAVGAAVSDHDDRRGQPAHLGGQLLDDRPDGPGLVVSGDHDRDRREAGHALAVGVDQRLDGGIVDYLVLRVPVDHDCAPSGIFGVFGFSGVFGSKSGQTVAMPASR